MLKRLSATLNGSGSGNPPSSSSSSHAPRPPPPHVHLVHSNSNNSLTSIYGTAYAQTPSSHEYSHHQSHHQSRYSSSPPISTPSLSSIGSGSGSGSGSGTAPTSSSSTTGYPRPAALSTPSSLNNNNGGGTERSPSVGYFGQQPYPLGGPSSTSSSSSSAHLAMPVLGSMGMNSGGVTPGSASASGSISPGNVSKTPSPMHSPQISFSPLPQQQQQQQLNANPSQQQQQQPPAPIDRLALQKSLKALETLLVALDEYRELNVRLAKVEKRLAKSSKELAGSLISKEELQMQPGGKLSQSSPYYSTIQALGITSTLFDSLSEVDTKFSRHLCKEYDTINDLCGKNFKKIAKDERAQDDLLESLDAKLKKANYNYDKRVRSSAPGSSGAQSAHEQFVPLLAQLTDDVTRSKVLHGFSMAAKREAVVKECARSMTVLADAEFRRTCENVRKLGVDVGPLLAVQALLGPSNGGKPRGPGMDMPASWPEDLPEPAEHTQQKLQQHQLQQQQQDQQLQQWDQPRSGRSLDDLLPPRAPFTTDADGARSSSSRPSSRQSNQQSFPTVQGHSMTSMPPRSASMNQINAQQSSLSYLDQEEEEKKYGNISQSGPGWNTTRGQRAVSQPVPSTSTSSHHDNDATVTMRNIQSKPTLDTSFFPKEQLDATPSFGHLPSARTPAVQSALSYSPSQSAKIGYFGTANTKRQLSGVREEEGDHTQVEIPAGFIVDETSPENFRRTGGRVQQSLNTNNTTLSSHSSPVSPNDSPTLSMAGTTNTSSASFSHIANESSYATTVSNGPTGSQTRAKDYGNVSSQSPAGPLDTAAAAAMEHSSMHAALDEFGRKKAQVHDSGGAQLERTPSIESTASEQSFVARMKAKYAQEREARKQTQGISHVRHGDHHVGNGASGSSVAGALDLSSSSTSKRVSSIAQKWEEKSQHGHSGGVGGGSARQASSYAGRPSAHHRASMPVISSVSHPSSAGRK